MSVIAICHDLESGAATELRESYLQAHLAYIETILDQLLVAGPVGGDTNADFFASVFVYDTDDPATAERLLHGDPYYRCGLYGEVRLERFTPAAGQWLGGKGW